MSGTGERRAIVIGAGIVGVCTALELQRRNWAVTIVDRLAPGEGCSFGNAGILAAQAVTPVAMPGILKKVPSMLLDPESPLTVRLGSLPTTLPWLLHFWRAAQRDRLEATADAMKALNGTSVELHEANAREAGVSDLLKPGRYLYVHRDARQINVEKDLAWTLRRDRGSEIELLEGPALHESEPELSREYTRGVRVGPMGFTLNPFRLTQAYAQLFESKGGTVRRAEVLSLKLVKPLGLRLQLIAERGYHMTFPKAGISLNHVISEMECQFAVTPMEMGLRVAGTEELGNADDAPAWRRAEVLKRQARRMFPNANLDNGSRWMGPRPGTPDSLPAIGPLPNHPNIFIAAGHGHLGLTGGPNTGRIVAALASNERLNIPLEPYAPDRFSTFTRKTSATTSAPR